VICTTFFLMYNVFSVVNTQDSTTITALKNHGRSIIWDVTLTFNESGGGYDYTVFGEAPDAHDGPPADPYDVTKPPAPIPPYVRAWFNDNLPAPYNKLWKDYRHYPGTMKVWNLSVQWVPSDYVSTTAVTISWDSTLFNDSEYAHVTLCTNLGVPLKDMLLYNTYTFTCPANTPQSFKIICLANHPPNSPNNPNPANQSTGVAINADLNWTGGDPDPGDTVTYDVCFGTTSPPPKIVNNQSATTYDPGTLAYQQTYYWKIIAWDNHRARTAGPLWVFTTKANSPPVFGTPSPSNGSTGNPLSLTWSIPINDPEGDTFNWTIQCSNGQANNGTSASNGTKTLALTGLAYSTSYKVWVNATDPGGSGMYTRKWYTFTTKANQPPYVPSNSSPPNGATNVSIPLELFWTGGDPDPGDTVTYDVYFGTMSPPVIMVHNQSATSYDPGPLLYNKTYYWKIVAWDNHNASTAGPIWNFTTEQQPDTTPPQVEITIPQKGYLYINLADFVIMKIPFFTTLIIGKLTVTANATDNQSGINRVEFYVDTELKANDTTAPYEWTWTERGHFFPYVLKAIAYDNAGHHNSAEVKVWKIF